jgi:hypothetical protein
MKSWRGGDLFLTNGCNAAYNRASKCFVGKKPGNGKKGGGMKKSLISTLWVAAVFSLMGLLVYTEAVAQAVGEECPVAYESKFYSNPNDPATEQCFGLKIVDIGKQTVDGYLYSYEITAPAGCKIPTVNQLVTLGPVCCPDLEYSVAGIAQGVAAPGAGDSTSDYGKGDYTSQAIRFTPSTSATPVYYFYTKNLSTRLENATVQFKSGKSYYYSNIGVPACSCSTATPYQPTIVSEEFYVKTRKIKVTWNEVGDTCAAVKVEFQNDQGGWVVVLPSDGPTLNGDPIKDVGPLDGNQKCKRSIISAGQDSYAWLYIGGNWYYICISLPC